MANINITDIDDVLRALRAERGDIERKEKARDEEYKRATKLYIKALQKETEAFERNRPNYDKRNESFKEEMDGIKERFKVGAFGLNKSNDRLKKEIDRLNDHLLEHYPRLAAQVKDNLQREKDEIETKLQRAREENERNQIPISHTHSYMPSVDVMGIRQKRHDLEKDLKPSSDTPYFSNVNPRSYQSQDAGHSQRNPSPHRNQSYLDEFVAKPEPSRRSPPRHSPIDMVYSQPYPQGQARARSHEKEREQDVRRSSKSPPRTDLLSQFLYPLPKTVFSPPHDEINHRKHTPTKSESLLYSPFTAGGDNESRFSSVKKSQHF